MAKIINQIQVKKYIILYLDVDWFESRINFWNVEIEGVVYKPEICYDAAGNVIAIEASGNFVGKEIKFI